MNNGYEYIYHCKAKETDPIEYEKPAKYKLGFNYLTIMPASGYTNATAYGKDIGKIYTAIAKAQYFNGVFKEGDLLYIEGMEPNENETYIGEYANAEIDSVRYQNLYINITIRKRKINGTTESGFNRTEEI